MREQIIFLVFHDAVLSTAAVLARIVATVVGNVNGKRGGVVTVHGN